MKWIRMLCVGLLLSLCVIGCGQKGPATTGDAVAGAQKAFATASAELKESLGNAIKAYQADDLVAAVMVMQTITASGSLTPEQSKAMDDFQGAIYGRLAELLEKGDPKAVKAREQLKQLRR
jgi:hypothetical protein